MIPYIWREDGLYHARFDDHPKRLRDRSLPRLLARVEKWVLQWEDVELREVA